MSFSDLEELCLSLDERLSLDYEAVSPESPAHAADVLNRWRQIACGDQPSIFTQRLELDGLDEALIGCRLGKVRRRPGVAAPAWLFDAEAVVRALVEGETVEETGVAQTLPFGPLISPLVGAAVSELALDSAWSTYLPEQARTTATRQLWQSLGELFNLPLFEAFNNWRSGQSHEGSSFADFTAHMQGAGFAALFERYPVLARVAGALRRHWIHSYGNLLASLRADTEMLAGEFGGGRPLVIADLRYGLSDPHGAGDAVIELVLADGQSLFYKPRSLASDAIVGDFLDYLRAAEPDFDLRMPHFVDRGTHGWTAGVRTAPCEDSASVARYYRRAGAWLACFHLLNASDMHMENILACGEHPIPIDFETILQALSTPPPVPALGSGAHWTASQLLEESVLAVGMLPGYVRADDGRTISVGGLEASQFEVKRLEWSNINTLSMNVALRRELLTVDTNLPSLDGTKIPIDAFRSEIIEGAGQVLRIALDHKKELQSFFRRLRGRGLVVRRVIRPTRFYYLLLRRLSDHRTMVDGVTWSMQSELIARLYDWDDMSRQPWKLFRQERADLCNMTVPAFYLEADRSVSMSWQGPVTNLHVRDGITVAIDRVDRLDADAVDQQCRFMATALGAETAPSGAIGHTVDLVDGIVEHLTSLAIRDGQSAAWLGLEYLDHRMMSQIVPIGHDLYNGNLGIALFLAAVGQTRGNPEASELARHAIAPIVGALASENRHRLIRLMGCGGFLGVGSLVYGLTAIAGLIPQGEDLLASARNAAALLTPEVLKADDRLDLVSGSAGALLAILKLYRSTGDAVLLEQALTIGNALAERPRQPGMPWTSAMFDHSPVTGLSHGASGFALALGELEKATKTQRFLPIVAELLEFERAHFESGTDNWRDTRPESMRLGVQSPNQWCYGAAGIGYARMALLDLTDASLAARLEEEAASAIRSILAKREHSNDTLCCGIAGHADFLVTAGEGLGNAAAVRVGSNRIEQISERWRRGADVSWDQGNKDFNLGLMRGLAGIGYAALRVENRALPNVLILA